MQTNSTGDYNQSGLTPGAYDIIVTAPGFKKFQAKAVKLDVAEKARVDVNLQVGAATTEVVVEGTNVAQVETQSSELAGTVTGKEITQLATEWPQLLDPGHASSGRKQSDRNG